MKFITINDNLAVEFPTNPLALKTNRQKSNGVCFVEADEVLELSQSNNSNYLTPCYKPGMYWLV